MFSLFICYQTAGGGVSKAPLDPSRRERCAEVSERGEAGGGCKLYPKEQLAQRKCEQFLSFFFTCD